MYVIQQTMFDIEVCTQYTVNCKILVTTVRGRDRALPSWVKSPAQWVRMNNYNV